MTIIRNSARCTQCGDEIESTHQHDFVTCTCGSVSVDGGKEYIRRCFKSEDCFEDTSLFSEAKPAEIPAEAL